MRRLRGPAGGSLRSALGHGAPFCAGQLRQDEGSGGWNASGRQNGSSARRQGQQPSQQGRVCPWRGSAHASTCRDSGAAWWFELGAARFKADSISLSHASERFLPSAMEVQGRARRHLWSLDRCSRVAADGVVVESREWGSGNTVDPMPGCRRDERLQCSQERQGVNKRQR